jgi:transposase-like protein
MQRKYSAKFKNHAVQQVLERTEHQTIKDVAMNLSVNVFTLKQWLKLDRRKNSSLVQPLNEVSIVELQKEIEFLKEELIRKDKLIVEMSSVLVYGKVA